MTARRFASLFCGVGVLFAAWMGYRELGAQNTGTGQAVLCSVVNSAATTAQPFSGQAGCVNRDSQIALFITDVNVSVSAIASSSSGQYPTLVYGSGTNCGTGQTIIWSSYNLAFQPVIEELRTPTKVPGGKDLCWIDSSTSSKTFFVSGFLGTQ